MKDEWVAEKRSKSTFGLASHSTSPVNWMVYLGFKKYMDEVYTTGMFGQLCNGDGRDEKAPKENYGAGAF